jgi:hypothetical protein
MHDRDEWIRNRAYMLWERNGHAHGHHQDHWQQACRDYDEMQAAADAVTEKSKKRVGVAAKSATLAESAR